MREYLLTIAIPTYNRLDNLRRLLFFIKKYNTENEIEVIVSNNCSEDGTHEFLEYFVKDNKWLNVNHNNNNIGGDANIRWLAKCAKGKYVLFLGDDDYISKYEFKNIVIDLKNYSPNLYQISNAFYDFQKNKFIKFISKNDKYKDRSIYVTEKNFRDLMSNDLSGFLFMSKNIYLKSDILEIIDKYSYNYCTNLLFSGYCMSKNKKVYISSRIGIVADCNQTISWSDDKTRVAFEIIPNVIKDFRNFNISTQCCNKILDAYISMQLLEIITKRKYLNYINFNVIYKFFFKLLDYIVKRSYPSNIDINSYVDKEFL